MYQTMISSFNDVTCFTMSQCHWDESIRLREIILIVFGDAKLLETQSEICNVECRQIYCNSLFGGGRYLFWSALQKYGKNNLTITASSREGGSTNAVHCDESSVTIASSILNTRESCLERDRDESDGNKLMKFN